MKMGFQVVVGAACLGAAAPAAADFVAGHLYSPTNAGYVIEWDANLREVRRFRVLSVGGCTGAVFNDVGNLVFIGMRAEHPRVFEVNSVGAIQREYDFGYTSLQRGSYIDFDPGTGRYAVANDHEITILDRELRRIGGTASFFNRASGVTFAPGGILLGNDQLNNGKIFRFDSTTLTQLSTIVLGGYEAGGMEVTAAGDLLLPGFFGMKLEKLVNSVPPVTTIVSNLADSEILDIRELLDGSLVTISFNGHLRKYTPQGVLTAAFFVGDFADGLAYYVPAPSSLLVLSTFGLCARRRRKSQ